MEQKTTSNSSSATMATTDATSTSAVESIVKALSELENDIDAIAARVEEMKKRIMAHSNEEIEKLKQQIIAFANEEAKKIIDRAKADAEAESSAVVKEAEKSLALIRKNIDASFDRAVDAIVKTVLESSGGSTIKEAAKDVAPTTASSRKSKR